MTLARWW